MPSSGAVAGPAPESSRPRQRGRGRGDSGAPNARGRGADRGRGRGRGRGGRGQSDDSNRASAQAAPSGGPRSEPVAAAKPSNGKAPALGTESAEEEVCFICANPVIHWAITPCNHITCHTCALRMRALYKNKDCPHCRVSGMVSAPAGDMTDRVAADPSAVRCLHR